MDADTDHAVTKAFIIDAETMAIIWANEPAASDAAAVAQGGDMPPIECIVPKADEVGLAEALREVADTGEPRHLRTNLVSTSRGVLTIAVSAYRIPSGELLVLIENAWQPDKNKQERETRRSTGRRR